MGGLGRCNISKNDPGGSFFAVPDFLYSSSTFTGLPVAMDSLQAMVNATDLNASLYGERTFEPSPEMTASMNVRSQRTPASPSSR